MREEGDSLGDFAARLRAARVSAGVTQMGLAQSAGLTQKHVSMLERGVSAPSRAAAIALAEALGGAHELRTSFLVAAGYVPDYTLRPPEMPRGDLVGDCLRCNRDQPAIAVSAAGDLLAVNDLGRWMLGEFALQDATSLCASSEDPSTLQALRERIENYEELAVRLARRTSRERVMRWRIRDAPGDADEPRGDRGPGPTILGHGDDPPWLRVIARVGARRVDMTLLLTTIGEPPFAPEASVIVVTALPMDEVTRALFHEVSARVGA